MLRRFFLKRGAQAAGAVAAAAVLPLTAAQAEQILKEEAPKLPVPKVIPLTTPVTDGTSIAYAKATFKSRFARYRLQVTETKAAQFEDGYYHATGEIALLMRGMAKMHLADNAKRASAGRLYPLEFQEVPS